MSSLSYAAGSTAEPPRAAVAAELDAGARTSRFHLIPSTMVGLGLHGLTSCGFPVDQLRLTPDCDWATLDPSQRCEHCAADPPP